MIWSDKGWICVYLMLILSSRSSYFESLDDIYVSFYSCLSVLELVSVSFVSISDMCAFRVFISE